MDFDMVLPQSIINNFKCAICQQYLSVPPVMTDDGTHFKCGRCKYIESNMNTKALGFEKLASFMTFPCTFNGCTKKLAWDDIQQHELICPYRLIKCPCYHCEETFNVDQVIAHFEEQHKKYKCIDECEVQNRNIKTPNRCLMRLLVCNNASYLMFNYRDTADFFFSVYSMKGYIENVSFEVIFSSTCGKYTIVVNDNPVVKFNEREHCINCLDQDCKSKFHKYSQLYKEHDKIYENMTTKINIDKVVYLMGSDTVNYKVRIIPKNKDEKVSTEIVKMDMFNTKAVLQNLECQVCKNYMSAPIFYCSIGHTICKTCKFQLMKCPTCSAPLSDSRCFALEDISDKINLECKNKWRGCSFAGNIDQIALHEQICAVIF